MTSGGAATSASLLGYGGRIGELVIIRMDGCYELRHRDDEKLTADSLQSFVIDEAFEVAKFDDGGAYRPLKTAPNLRHGWRIGCATAGEVRRAIDQIYPARLAAATLHEQDLLTTTPLRETLNRQSGMYKVAARISDDRIDDLVAGFCRSDGGCLRTIFWKRDASGAVASTKLPAAKFDPDHDQTGRGESSVPLICQEACNLLVAAAREVVRANDTSSKPSGTVPWQMSNGNPQPG